MHAHSGWLCEAAGCAGTDEGDERCAKAVDALAEEMAEDRAYVATAVEAVVAAVTTAVKAMAMATRTMATRTMAMGTSVLGQSQLQLPRR